MIKCGVLWCFVIAFKGNLCYHTVVMLKIFIVLCFIRRMVGGFGMEYAAFCGKNF